LFVGGNDNRPCDTELSRQIARGRQLRIRAQRTVPDLRPELILDLTAKRSLAVAGD